MARTAKVIAHKSEAMRDLSRQKGYTPTDFERHLDRAIAAAELLNGILDDTVEVG